MSRRMWSFDPAPFCLSRGSLPIKSMYVSRPFLRMDFLCNSHAGITHLVSVLDLDNVIVGLDDHRTPTRVRPITPIISLNDVNCATDRAMRPNRTRKNQNGAF